MDGFNGVMQMLDSRGGGDDAGGFVSAPTPATGYVPDEEITLLKDVL